MRITRPLLNKLETPVTELSLSSASTIAVRSLVTGCLVAKTLCTIALVGAAVVVVASIVLVKCVLVFMSSPSVYSVATPVIDWSDSSAVRIDVNSLVTGCLVARVLCTIALVGAALVSDAVIVDVRCWSRLITRLEASW